MLDQNILACVCGFSQRRELRMLNSISPARMAGVRTLALRDATDRHKASKAEHESTYRASNVAQMAIRSLWGAASLMYVETSMSGDDINENYDQIAPTCSPWYHAKASTILRTLRPLLLSDTEFKMDGDACCSLCSRARMGGHRVTLRDLVFNEVLELAPNSEGGRRPSRCPQIQELVQEVREENETLRAFESLLDDYFEEAYHHIRCHLACLSRCARIFQQMSFFHQMQTSPQTQ